MGGLAAVGSTIVVGLELLAVRGRHSLTSSYDCPQREEVYSCVIVSKNSKLAQFVRK